MTEMEAPVQADTSPGGAAAGQQSETLPAIELTGVVKEFHSGGEVITAVRGLDLAIRQGEFFSMLGPSGCGKTTTMRIIAGFEEHTPGSVSLQGSDVTWDPPTKCDVNKVFQPYPHSSPTRRSSNHAPP